MRARPLERSTDDRMIAGVAGGIARWIGVDATLVRVAFVALTFANLVGALAYAILMIVLPSDAGRLPPRPVDVDPPTTPLATPPHGAPTATSAPAGEDDERRAARARQAIGGGIAAIGLWLLARQIGLVPDLAWSVIAPLVLIGVGILLLAGRAAGGEQA